MFTLGTVKYYHTLGDKLNIPVCVFEITLYGYGTVNICIRVLYCLVFTKETRELIKNQGMFGVVDNW